MRIIAGKKRGMKLQSPGSDLSRPIRRPYFSEPEFVRPVGPKIGRARPCLGCGRLR